jgi:2-polyprenyl-3-methyl-5-hydroxy-6-metoxy-1,4-benzoquinol methylase
MLRFRAKDLNRRITEERFDYHRCSSCCLIFLYPVPKNLGYYYPTEYYCIPSTLEELAKGAEAERYKIDIIRQFAPRGRLLEIGPGTGGFAYLSKEAGFQVETIEMDRRCCLFIREVLKIPAIESDDTINALKQTARFNVIALWHVIEHLPNPWATLDAITEHLLPEGVLVLAAPNPEALQFRLLGRFWTHIDAPRHLQLIPIHVLTEFMHGRRLRTLLTSTNDEGCLGWNRFGWTFSLANCSSSPFVKTQLRVFGGIVTKILEPVERKNGVGSTYTLLFQKEGVS